MADHPLRPATRHRLGRPLPYQLADGPQAIPCLAILADDLYPALLLKVQGPSAITSPFDELWPWQGLVIYVLLTRSPVTLAGPHDLHALSTPPAFILS